MPLINLLWIYKKKAANAIKQNVGGECILGFRLYDMFVKQMWMCLNRWPSEQMNHMILCKQVACVIFNATQVTSVTDVQLIVCALLDKS